MTARWACGTTSPTTPATAPRPSVTRDEANEGVRPWTKIFDHYFFDSCYAMSPEGGWRSAPTGPGFQLDEKLEDLGDRLCLSPRVEPLRAKLRIRADADRQPAPAQQGQGQGASTAPPPATAADRHERRSRRPSRHPSANLRLRQRPDPVATPRVLDVLAARDLRASFFVVGEALRRAPRAGRARPRRGPLDRQPHAHPPAPAGRERGGGVRDRGRPRRELGALAHPDRLFRPSGAGGDLSPGLLSTASVETLDRGPLHVRALERRCRATGDDERWVETALAPGRVAGLDAARASRRRPAPAPTGWTSSCPAWTRRSSRTSRRPACRSAAAPASAARSLPYLR